MPNGTNVCGELSGIARTLVPDGVVTTELYGDSSGEDSSGLQSNTNFGNGDNSSD